MAARVFGKDVGSWKGPWSPDKLMASTQQMPFYFVCHNNTTGVTECSTQLYCNPENYQVTWMPRASVTLTQGGVHEDKAGIALPKFQIYGVFGLQGRKTEDNDGKPVTGPALFRQLEQSLMSFYERCGTYRLDGQLLSTSDDLEIRFLNYSDREYWIVQINSFIITRNIQRPLLYQYTIQMTGLKRMGNEAADRDAGKQLQNKLDGTAVSNAATETSEWNSIIGTLGGGLSAIQGAVGQLNSLMATISTAVSNFSNGVTTLVNLPASVLTTAISTCKTILNATQNISNAPFELVNSTRNTLRTLYGLNNNISMFQQNTTTIGTTAADTSGANQTSAIEIMTTPVASSLYANGSVVKMNIPEETIFSSDIETTTPKASASQSIRDNDTIISIAAKAGVDWKEIVTLNNLEYPYIATDDLSEELSAALTPYPVPAGTIVLPMAFSPIPLPGSVMEFPDESTGIVNTATSSSVTLDTGTTMDMEAKARVSNHAKQLSVLKPGDKILIPSDDQHESGVAVSSGSDLETKLFGIDESLDTSGNIWFDTSQDIASVSGMDNLEMQLQHRIVTKRGELTELGHPEYGSLVPAYIGQPDIQTNQELVLMECIATIMSDPRVQSVDNATLTDNNGTIYFEGMVKPINKLPSTLVSIPLA